jgi:uncharacterized protein YqiB (DUF1249 family)
MGDRNAAQAAELVRALREQLRDMTDQLARVEHQLPRLTAWNHPAHEMRLEAAALRRDIAEAQVHIDRLQRRYYLSGDTCVQQGSSRSKVPRDADGSA